MSTGFLPSTTGSSAVKQSGASAASSAESTDKLAHAGALASTLASLKPNLAAGDRLDLSHALAGAPVAQDLTNVGGVVAGLGHGLHPQGAGQAGRSTVDTPGAAGGQPIPQTHGSGKLDVVDLLKHNPLIPPSS
jgi:hypothetical protein